MLASAVGAPLAAEAGMADLEAILGEYCFNCHDSGDPAGGIALDQLELMEPTTNVEAWEKVLSKLRHREMPPVGRKSPTPAEYDQFVAYLQTSIDADAKAHPNPGRTETLRRLTRTEYQNAIRDLLALDIDATQLLPQDEPSHGFDNVTVSGLSPTHLDRYITAAQRIGRLAVASPVAEPGTEIIRLPADLTQERRVEGLPLGTRGGTLITHTFPRNGEYDIRVRLMRDRNEFVEGLSEAHTLQVLLDRVLAAEFTVEPPTDRQDHALVDAHLNARVQVSAGPHDLGITFIEQASALLETQRQPFQASFNMHRHPRTSPAVYEVSILGPYDDQGATETPSRKQIFVCHPATPSEEDGCATAILERLVRLAYRRPIAPDDLDGPLSFYHEGKSVGGFEAGVERAIEAILVSPEFLFRVESQPENVPPLTPYRVPDIQLASRLSFFLWSSIPDENLLELAARGELSKPDVLRKQVQRMLDDPKSKSLSTNFASQWLHLPKLDGWSPDLRQFPDFDDNLRQAFREETERFFDSVLKEDRSVLDLLKANYTYVNERLARHYDIPNVYGSRFRRVSLEEIGRSGGILRQGSVLTVTSYATRTSPVIRGKWVLENILASPPPPPPPNIPDLKDNTVSALLPMRERLAEHRANPACARCHNVIDPIGFSLENFDAIGRWRDSFEGMAIDTDGGLPGGSPFSGVAGLEDALLSRPDLFAEAVTGKMLTFALGRGMTYLDAPAIREIASAAKADGYRMSSLIIGIVESVPFQMRNAS